MEEDQPVRDLLRMHITKIEQVLESEIKIGVQAAQSAAIPAWKRCTDGEPRWPVSLVVIVAIVLQLLLNAKYRLEPRYLVAGLAIALLVGLTISNPKRVCRESAILRTASLVLTSVMSVANMWSVGELVRALVNGHAGEQAAPLLLAGVSIWGTNVILFALWYWEFDRGGPAARANARKPYPDFLFPQMATPEMASPDWEPYFIDYLYLSFTNATAFSPTDVMPLSRWTKLMMTLQSSVSLITAALVIARAVNILK